jgi:hypothetical protein
MQVTDINSSALPSGLSILKSANEQPKLAGELINRTVENMVQIQAAQSPAQRIDISEITGTGKIINTAA